MRTFGYYLCDFIFAKYKDLFDIGHADDTD
jgi:hypothetical protein